jgi:REP element-mobilizing transposase RayT/DNA-binding XRE family transcriptional regulator
MSFGRFLHQLRTKQKPKKMSQEQVGKIIGTTRQYIDAIEKQKINTSPPRFQQCVRLAEALAPDEKTKLEFMWLAFKERIRNNWDYYEYLHKNEGQRPEIGSYDAIAINRRPNTIQLRCKYEVQWVAKTPITISEDDSLLLERTITEHLHSIKFSLDALAITDTQISLIIAAPSPESIIEFTEGLKELTSRTLKTHSSDIIIHAPSIWEEGYLIRTVEYPLEVHIPASAKKHADRVNA